MAFTTMHFAVGMAGTGAVACVGTLLMRRGFRWIPMAMTLGGAWACVPDMPRLFRVDFPGLGFASSLGSKSLEQSLHANGDWFFFHRMLDAQPKEFALHGLFGILALYTLSNFLLAVTHRRPRKTLEPTSEIAAEQTADPAIAPVIAPPAADEPEPSRHAA